jgi:hypothetical protein
MAIAGYNLPRQIGERDALTENQGVDSSNLSLGTGRKSGEVVQGEVRFLHPQQQQSLAGSRRCGDTGGFIFCVLPIISIHRYQHCRTRRKHAYEVLGREYRCVGGCSLWPL